MDEQFETMQDHRQRSRVKHHHGLKVLLWLSALWWLWKILHTQPWAVSFGQKLQSLPVFTGITAFFTVGKFGAFWAGLSRLMMSSFWLWVMGIGFFFLYIFPHISSALLNLLNRIRSFADRHFYKWVPRHLHATAVDYVRIFRHHSGNHSSVPFQECIKKFDPNSEVKINEEYRVDKENSRFRITRFSDNGSSDHAPLNPGFTYNPSGSGCAVRPLHYKYEYPVVSENGFGRLFTGPALVKDSDGLLHRVFNDEILWECEAAGQKIYLRLTKGFFRRYVEIYKAPTANCRVIGRPKNLKKLNHRVCSFEIQLEINGRITHQTLTHECRVSQASVDEGNPAFLLYRSGYYPYVVAALYGPVGCGKTCWRDSLIDNCGVAGKNISLGLIPGLSIAPITNAALQAPQGHTPLGSLLPTNLDLVLNNEMVGCIYLIDLSGEITRSAELESSGSADRGTADRIISSVCDLASVLFVMMDHRSVCPLPGDDPLDGNPTAALYQLPKDLARIYVCTNADTIYERVGTSPLQDTFHTNGDQEKLLLTDASPLFDSVSTSDGNSKSLLLQHMAIANDVLSTLVFGVERDAPSFLIQSMEPVVDGDGNVLFDENGRELRDYSRQVNAELPIAWLIYRCFGRKIYEGGWEHE